MYEAVMVSGEPNAEERGCYDCRHCKAALSWWCTNEDAKKARGTAIPGVIHCPYWAAVDVVQPILKPKDGFFKNFFRGFGKIKIRGQ